MSHFGIFLFTLWGAGSVRRWFSVWFPQSAASASLENLLEMHPFSPAPALKASTRKTGAEAGLLPSTQRVLQQSSWRHWLASGDDVSVYAVVSAQLPFTPFQWRSSSSVGPGLDSFFSSLQMREDYTEEKTSIKIGPHCKFVQWYIFFIQSEVSTL